DVTANAGCVSLGISNATAPFAVNSIRCWLDVMRRERYPNMNQLMITADGGGSNGSRVRLFKIELQRLPLCHSSCRLHRIKPMGALDEGTWLDTVRSSKSAWSRDCCRRRVRRWKR